jgi:hypothetical protein
VAEPFRDRHAAPDAHQQFRGVIEAGGAEPVEEFGVLAGEVRGLEVCRVVDDPHTGETRLEVGIGAHDRDAFAMIHGTVPTPESLARVVAVVAAQRRLEAPPHPFNRLARERLLRWQLTVDPSPLGALDLRAVAPPVPRRNLKDPVPCVAVGHDTTGRELIVVCSVGVDLDLIPFAADARMASGGAPRLVVVTPARDRIAVIGEIAGLLREPCELLSVD